MTSHIVSAAVHGMYVHPISVEVDIYRRGFPYLRIVGLPDKSVVEARERVKSAIRNSDYKIPQGKIVINLAPPDTQKTGTVFDVAIALGLLTESRQIPHTIFEKAIVIGGLTLDGAISPVRGAFAIAHFAATHNYSYMYTPAENKKELQHIKGIHIIPCRSLRDVCDHVRGVKKIHPIQPVSLPKPTPPEKKDDMISGQNQAKRAVILAAAGGHNLFLKGPPGNGKTMLTSLLANLLPPMSDVEWQQSMIIQSLFSPSHVFDAARPVRKPHHSISRSGLIGGGIHAYPGEATRAHLGILVLDELPEFSRTAIESLRQPMDDGEIVISNARGSTTYPTKCIFIATANPCPCGYLGHPTRECTCSQVQIKHYAHKISGPILDRMDIHVFVHDVSHTDLSSQNNADLSLTQARKKIQKARATQRTRYQSEQLNAHLSNKEIAEHCLIEKDASTLLSRAYKKLGLSARSYFKTIKIAQTIADLAGSDSIMKDHIAEALQYRI